MLQKFPSKSHSHLGQIDSLDNSLKFILSDPNRCFIFVDMGKLNPKHRKRCRIFYYLYSPHPSPLNRKIELGSIYILLFITFSETCCAWLGWKCISVKYILRRIPPRILPRYLGFLGFGCVKQLDSSSIGAWRWKQKISSTHIFMLKPRQDFNFTQGPLAISLMFERWYLLDGDFYFRNSVVGGAGMR